MAELTQDEKDKELYKVALPAFFQNELENDKTILGLCTASIGFYIAIFQTNMKVTELMFIVSQIALAMLLITIIIILYIFVLNRKQILSIVLNNGRSDEDKILEKLDEYKYYPFAIAMISSVIFAYSIIFQSIK